MEVVGCVVAGVALVWVVLDHIRHIKGPNEVTARLDNLEEYVAQLVEADKTAPGLESRIAKTETMVHEFVRELNTLKSSLALKQSFGK